MAVDPGTRSPGHLVIYYNDRGLDHSCSVAFVDGVDIQAVSAVRADAVALAAALQPCFPPDRTITGWGIRPAGGGSTYREAFTPALSGTGTNTAGAPNWYSFTITLMGRAAGTGVGAARGSTRIVLFTGNNHPGIPGSTELVGAMPPDIQGVIDHLASSTRLFADSYGQKADFTGNATVQFNAHTQRVRGL
jgi:hypothetical protein